VVITNPAFTAVDFLNVLNEFGRQIGHSSITKTLSNLTNKETLTEATPTAITAYFVRTSQSWDYDKAGLFEKGQAIMLAKYEDGVAKDDIIYADGTNKVIFSIEGTATTITIFCTGHGVTAGDTVLILDTTNYDGSYTVASVTNANTFVITDNAHNYSAEAGAHLMVNYTKFRIKETWPVVGTFAPNDAGTDYVYTVNSLFIENGS